MEFCSKYGYDYGFQGSDEEDFDEEDFGEVDQIQDLNAPAASKKEAKKIRKADSNIIAVKFDELTVSNETFAGETKHCSKCSAIPTVHSLPNIKAEQDNSFIWTCEFCAHVNKLLITSLNEIPNKEDVTFLIEPANSETTSDNNEKNLKSNDDNFLTYCIDISGSMDTKIPSNDNQSNITRLNGVKIACLENLTSLKETEPNKKCSLVTFSDSIKYYGDGARSSYQEPLVNTSNQNMSYMAQQASSRGFSQRLREMFSKSNNSSSQQDQQIASDILTNQEKMLALGANQPNDLNGISKSYDKLKNIIEHLRTEGSTALGPALVFSIGHSSKKECSQIILCTDGAANIGMGSIGNDNATEKFYDDLADYAKAKSIQINIVTMQGTDCKLAFLGRLADKTNGTMNIVNPNNLSEQFKSILENRIVATKVKATLIVNEKYLYLRDKELEAEEAKVIEEYGNRQAGLDRIEKLKKSKITNDIGNASMDTEITFEYGIRRLETDAASDSSLNEMPFQLQIEYIHNGAKFLRVYTKKQAFTKNRDEALNNLVSREILFSNAMNQISEHAMCSNNTATRYRSKAITNVSEQRGLRMPQLLLKQKQIIGSLQLRSANLNSYNDTESEFMYKAKKMARKNLF